MTDTQAAVAAALMQAAETAHDYTPEKRGGGTLAAHYTGREIEAAILALIPADAMAALEAMLAGVRKVKSLVWYRYENHPYRLWRAYCETLRQEWIIWADCPDVAAEKAKVETERAARILAALEGGE